MAILTGVKLARLDIQETSAKWYAQLIVKEAVRLQEYVPNASQATQGKTVRLCSAWITAWNVQSPTLVTYVSLALVCPIACLLRIVQQINAAHKCRIAQKDAQKALWFVTSAIVTISDLNATSTTFVISINAGQQLQPLKPASAQET